MCKSQKYNEGTLNLSLQTGLKIVNVGKYSFINPPLFTHVYPIDGLIKEGPVITIEGKHLEEASSCYFGDVHRLSIPLFTESKINIAAQI